MVKICSWISILPGISLIHMFPYHSLYFLSGKSLFFTSPSHGQEKKSSVLFIWKRKSYFYQFEMKLLNAIVDNKDVEKTVQKQFIFELVNF